MKTLQEIKDEVAKMVDFPEWEFLPFDALFNLNDSIIGYDDLVDLSIKLYANSKLDEAASKVTLKIERNGKHIFKGNYAIIADDNDHIEVEKQSILSLKDKI